MNEFFETGLLGDTVLWGVTVWRLGLAVLIIFSGFLSRRLVHGLFAGFLRRRVGRTNVQWDDDAIDLMEPPLALVVQVMLWYAAAAVLTLPTEPIDLQAFVFQGLDVAMAVAVTWVVFRLLDVLSRAADRLSERTESRLDDQVIPLLRKTLKVFIAIVVAVMVVEQLGYSVTSLIASLGIGGLALALAAKDTVANFFGSLVIFTDQPFHVGDWVEFGDVEGVVEEVGMRTTRIRLFNKSLATVPNQTFTSNTIINHSKRPVRRVRLLVGLSYETSPEQVRTFLVTVRQMLEARDDLDPENIFVYFNEFGASSLDVLIQCFTLTTVWTEFMTIQQDIMLHVMRLVEEQGLEIAFPTRTVYFRDEHWNGVSIGGEREAASEAKGDGR